MPESLPPRIPRLDVLRCEMRRVEPFTKREPEVWWFWRLFWFSHPACRLHLADGRTLPVPARHLFLIPPTMRYAPSVTASSDHLFVHFSVEGLPESQWAKAFPSGAAVAAGNDLRQIQQRLQAELRSHPTRSIRASLLALSLVSSTFAAALDALPARAQESVRRALSAPDPLMRAKAHAVTHRGNCRISDLARVAHASPDHFTRRFRETYGATPTTYLKELRLQHAVDLLIHSEHSLETVAERCGFGDRHYFTRVFSRWAGTGPATFRQRCQGF